MIISSHLILCGHFPIALFSGRQKLEYMLDWITSKTNTTILSKINDSVRMKLGMLLNYQLCHRNIDEQQNELVHHTTVEKLIDCHECRLSHKFIPPIEYSLPLTHLTGYWLANSTLFYVSKMYSGRTAVGQSVHTSGKSYGYIKRQLDGNIGSFGTYEFTRPIARLMKPSLDYVLRDVS